MDHRDIFDFENTKKKHVDFHYRESQKLLFARKRQFEDFIQESITSNKLHISLQSDAHDKFGYKTSKIQEIEDTIIILNEACFAYSFNEAKGLIHIKYDQTTEFPILSLPTSVKEKYQIFYWPPPPHVSSQDLGSFECIDQSKASIYKALLKIKGETEIDEFLVNPVLKFPPTY